MSVRTDLQVAMQRYIDRSLIDGAIVDIDAESGAMRHLFPVKAHPMVMKADDYFVLCAHLSDPNGQEFEVDYYLIETDIGFRVFRVEVDNREVLHDLMAAGFVSEY